MSELKKSTPECRKDCDVYSDWKKMECVEVDHIQKISKLEAEIERLNQLVRSYENPLLKKIELWNSLITQLKDAIAILCQGSTKYDDIIEDCEEKAATETANQKPEGGYQDGY